MAHNETVSVDGHRLKLTNLEKVLYPTTGTTKADVIGYYSQIADVLIPHAADRPATRKRWVDGVGTAEDPGDVFFQKNLDDATPSWVKRRTIQHSDHTNVYPLVNDTATLVWLAQIASLEVHVPQWTFASNGKAKNPDRLVLDLDPGEGVSLADTVEVARWAREVLKDLGLDPVPVTSGSKGIHLYAALDGSASSDEVSDAAHEIARVLEADHPDRVVSKMKRSLRAGKVFVDWSQNNANKTTIVPYSLRGRPRPTVAVPRQWRELDADIEQLDYEQVLARMKRRKDPMAAMKPARLPGVRRKGSGSSSQSAQISTDRLARYRSMRDAEKTPEPVPDKASSAAPGRSFVIQEHHARRLHWDFRLERDGVLASWALPKGVPTDTRKNHLAVQTEDHPLEYGSFEGHIPKGEYGGGQVTIWDSGEYEEHKWRDGEEVIVTLRGTDDGGLGGERTYALIHTGGAGQAKKNWLIHLMKDQPDYGEEKPAKRPARKGENAPKRQAGKKASTRLPDKPIEPMLAKLGTVDDLGEDADWALEMKWDGVRTLAYVSGDDPVRLRSRRGNDVTVTYPDITGPVAEAFGGGSAVLDGEIVAPGKGGRPDFGVLQKRMGLTKKADVSRAVESTPVQYMIFDVLWLDGDSLVRRPYDERRRMLDDVVRSGGSIQVPPAFEADVDAAMDSSRELGLEGIVAKRTDGSYRPGRRARSWIKVKHHRTQEVVVVGWHPGKGRRAQTIGALLLAVNSDGGLRYVGKVGTGFSDADLSDFESRFRSLKRKSAPVKDVPRPDTAGVHWLTPKLVGEVEFAEWTGGRRLRQPSWRGWRPDKKPGEVVEES